jgi:hypothetical protein
LLLAVTVSLNATIDYTPYSKENLQRAVKLTVTPPVILGKRTSFIIIEICRVQQELSPPDNQVPKERQ